VTTRFSKPDLQVLERVCKDRGQDVGGFIRLATLKELAALGAFDDLRSKTLGVDTKSMETSR